MIALNNPARIAIHHNQTLIEATSEDQECVGSLIAARWGDGVFLYKLYVEPEHRQKRIGTALIEMAIQTFADESEFFYLAPQAFDTKPMNEQQLRAWYTKIGFEPIGVGLMVLKSVKPNEGSIHTQNR